MQVLKMIGNFFLRLLKDLRIIFFIVLALMATLFVLTIVMPSNVMEAVEIFKNFFKIP